MSATPECFDAAFRAAKGRLKKETVEEAFAAAERLKKKFADAGDIDRMADRLMDAAEREAERTRIAAALAKRHAALTVLKRDQLHQTIAAFRAAGMAPVESLLAILEGSQKGIAGARNSVDALAGAYEGRYVGDLFAAIQRERPHLRRIAHDAAFDRDLTREMHELRDGGTPGRTGNRDAQWLAERLRDATELSRTDLNRLGAAIGRLDGWSGAQTHDPDRIVTAGLEQWRTDTLGWLDLDRTFADIDTPEQLREALDDVFETLVTGVPRHARGGPATGRVNPANLARSLGKSRVLHFRDADAALAYRAKYGTGTTIGGLIRHQQRAARLAAVMERLGPNPEAMFDGLVRRLTEDVRGDRSLPIETKRKHLEQLRFRAGPLREALDVSLGLHAVPVSARLASVGRELRAMQSLAKLGGAVISSIPADTVTAAQAAMFRGTGFWRGLLHHVGQLRAGATDGELKEIAALAGEGFDGFIGQIARFNAGEDGGPGIFSRNLETFFKWSGLSGWTDMSRGAAVRTIMAEMGLRLDADFAALPANYAHVLGLNGITAEKWAVLRKAGTREIGGRHYFSPELVGALDDDAVRPLAQDAIDRLDAALQERLDRRAGQTAEEQDWVAKRSAKLAAGFAKGEAGLTASLDRMRARASGTAGRIEARSIALGEKLSEIAEFFSNAKATRPDLRAGRKPGQDEGWIRRRMQEMAADMAAIDRELAAAGAEKAADFMGTWQQRRDELKLFTDRMDRNQAAREAESADDLARQPERIARAIADARRDLDLDVRRFFADETRYAIVEMDARSTRTTTLGAQRPGTLAGEAIRFFMQFKGFPIAYGQRVLGRALMGHAGATARDRLTAGLPHLGAILASATVAGYMAMTLKDLARGYWPPRDPTDPETMIAAMLQGGAFGIYGDFLFGKASRFGNGPLATFMGPTFGMADSVSRTWQLAKQGDAKAADFLNIALQNTPFIPLPGGLPPIFPNLFYLRPALDSLFLDALRNQVSPGWLDRQDDRRREDYGQARWRPSTGS